MIIYDQNNDNIGFLKTLKSDFSSVRSPTVKCVVENFAGVLPFILAGFTEKKRKFQVDNVRDGDNMHSHKNLTHCQ